MDDHNNDQKATADADKKPSSGITMESNFGSESGMAMQDGDVERGDEAITSNVETGDIERSPKGEPSKEAADLTDEERLELEAAEAEDQKQTADDDGGEPLPDFDPEKPEVKEAYEKRFKKDGKLSLEALSKEWDGNAKGDLSKGTLTEGTYKYLESIGIDRETAKRVERNQVIALEAERDAIYAKVEGGKEALEAMIEWGKKGGYTDAQKEAFNKAFKGADPVAREDAIEALTARYKKAHPRERPVTPGKTTQGSGNAKDAEEAKAAGGGYKDNDEWRQAFNEANKLKGPQGERAREEVRKKLRASAFYKARLQR